MSPAVRLPRNVLKDISLGPLVHPVLSWTHGESNPGLIHAMDVCYHYTMGPIAPDCSIQSSRLPSLIWQLTWPLIVYKWNQNKGDNNREGEAKHNGGG